MYNALQYPGFSKRQSKTCMALTAQHSQVKNSQKMVRRRCISSLLRLQPALSRSKRESDSETRLNDLSMSLRNPI